MERKRESEKETQRHRKTVRNGQRREAGRPQDKRDREKCRERERGRKREREREVKERERKRTDF